MQGNFSHSQRFQDVTMDAQQNELVGLNQTLQKKIDVLKSQISSVETKVPEGGSHGGRPA